MKIIIVPFEDIEKKALERLKLHIHGLIKSDVEIHKGLPLPNCRWRSDQASASDFMFVLQEAAASESADYAVGVTKRDLYDFFNPELNYIFGFASGSSCIVSTARLKGELLMDRLLKEAAHELGRCFGISHCDNPECLMFFPNSVREIDNKENGFCSRCRPKLKEAV